MYDELLTRVAEEMRRFGAAPAPPASPDRLDRLRLRVRAELRADLPDGYVELLRRTDGFDWNGVLIYPSGPAPSGFVEMNLIHRDDVRFADLLVFGTDGLDLYAGQVSTGRFQVYDEVPHHLIESYPSFEALLKRALERSLR